MMENQNTKKWIVLAMSELPKVDFSMILENSIDTLRFSVDQKKTFIKWEGEEPSFVSFLDSKEGPYDYDEFMTILQTSEWIVHHDTPYQ